LFVPLLGFAVQTKTTALREFTLLFDQDETRQELPVLGEIPKEVQLQIEVFIPNPVESKAKIKTAQKLVFGDAYPFEVSLEVWKNTQGKVFLKVTPWIGNKVNGLPCNLNRLNDILQQLPGRIQDATTRINEIDASAQSVSHDLDVWINGGYFVSGTQYTPPSSNPIGGPASKARLVEQQTAIIQCKNYLQQMAGKRSTLVRVLERSQAQAESLPQEIQEITKIKGTKVKYRVYYLTGGKEINIPFETLEKLSPPPPPVPIQAPPPPPPPAPFPEVVQKVSPPALPVQAQPQAFQVQDTPRRVITPPEKPREGEEKDENQKTVESWGSGWAFLLVALIVSVILYIAWMKSQ
jgi:hypothetical protein